MTTEPVRQEFERWYGKEYSTYALQTWNGTNYENLDTNLAWRAWNQSALNAESAVQDATRYRALRRVAVVEDEVSATMAEAMKAVSESKVDFRTPGESYFDDMADAAVRVLASSLETS